MSKQFVPDNFNVPAAIDTDRCLLRKLTTLDAEKDYEAVMLNLEHLKGTFGPLDDWPLREMTPEQNLKDLKQHEKEFRQRKAFTYKVMDLQETRYLGCVYILPPGKAGYDAKVIWWVISGEVSKGLDGWLSRFIKKWLREEWPFRKVVYPGRDIDWEKWESLS